MLVVAAGNDAVQKLLEKGVSFTSFAAFLLSELLEKSQYACTNLRRKFVCGHVLVA